MKEKTLEWIREANKDGDLDYLEKTIEFVFVDDNVVVFNIKVIHEYMGNSRQDKYTIVLKKYPYSDKLLFEAIA